MAVKAAGKSERRLKTYARTSKNHGGEGGRREKLTLPGSLLCENDMEFIIKVELETFPIPSTALKKCH
jgi:hypothetical protein